MKLLQKIKGLTFKEFCMKAINRVFGIYGECSPLVYNFRNYLDNDWLRALCVIIASPYGLFKYLFHKPMPAEQREGLAVVAIAKNEGDYIEEWINFYVKQGVSHFFIYDNDSTDNMHEVLKPYVTGGGGIVTYQKIPGKLRQKDAYNMAIHDYKNKFRYMAFLDLDEFCFCLEHGKNLYDFVDEFMNEHPNAGGLCPHWLVFGSSGHETKPEGGVLKNFLMCSDKSFSSNQLVKTICDPEKVLSFESVHVAAYVKGYYNLNENGEIITVNYKKVTFDKIRINHYFSKSKEEFLKKRNKGMSNIRGLRRMEEFIAHDQNVIKDTEILSHI